MENYRTIRSRLCVCLSLPSSLFCYYNYYSLISTYVTDKYVHAWGRAQYSLAALLSFSLSRPHYTLICARAFSVFRHRHSSRVDRTGHEYVCGPAWYRYTHFIKETQRRERERRAKRPRATQRICQNSPRKKTAPLEPPFICVERSIVCTARARVCMCIHIMTFPIQRITYTTQYY